MNKRNTQQRRHLIVSQLQQQGELSVEQLAEQFHTSEVTIRKDLTVLEQAGLLLRRYGGAVPVPLYQDAVADEMAYVLDHAGVVAWQVGRSVVSPIPDAAFTAALTVP